MSTNTSKPKESQPENPSLSPDFLNYMDRLLAEHHWEENDLRGGESGKRFRSVLFDFVRKVMAWPTMCHLTAKEALRWIHQWFKVSGHGWRDFSGLQSNEREESDMLFLRTWADVKFPEGDDPLTLAYKRAIEQPVTLLKEHCLTDGYERFVGLIFHLHRFNENYPTLQRAEEGCMVLPCRKLADVIGLSHETIACYRKFAVDHGFLEQKKPHKFSPLKRKSEATEFRFVLERFDPETRQELPVADPTKGKTDETPKPEPKINDDSGQALPEVLNPSRKKTPNYVIEPILREHVWPYYLNKVDRLAELCSWTANRQRMAISCFREALRITEAKWNVSQAIQLMLHAIDNLAASDFHMGQNAKTRGETFNDWEHVFGTVDKFKKWIGCNS
jgi:hypothetical protein